MSHKVNEKELVAVMSLPASDRYKYFLNKVTDWCELWGVGNDEGWSMVGCDAGEAMPVWPASDFAAACCIGEWKDSEPKPISLPTWMKKWLPGLTEDSLRVAVFPLPTDKGLLLDPQQLEADLEESLKDYE